MTSNSDKTGSIDDAACATGAAENSRQRQPIDVRAEKALARRRRRGVRARAALNLAMMAQEYIWLWDVRHGVSANEIAIREGLSYRRVRQGLARARALENSSQTDSSELRPPPLIPLFPIVPFTPLSACGHHHPIERGSLFCCMVCHSSGIDGHPALLRSPLTDPAPEPKPAPPVIPRQTKRETRKERRQKLYGTTVLATSA